MFLSVVSLDSTAGKEFGLDAIAEEEERPLEDVTHGEEELHERDDGGPKKQTHLTSHITCKANH